MLGLNGGGHSCGAGSSAQGGQKPRWYPWIEVEPNPAGAELGNGQRDFCCAAMFCLVLLGLPSPHIIHDNPTAQQHRCTAE